MIDIIQPDVTSTRRHHAGVRGGTNFRIGGFFMTHLPRVRVRKPRSKDVKRLQAQSSSSWLRPAGQSRSLRMTFNDVHYRH